MRYKFESLLAYFGHCVYFCLSSNASEEKRESLEAQSRRKNLSFYGMAVERDDSWEGTENMIRDYINKVLEIDQSTMSIERAHRIQSLEKPRPVIVKFSFYKDKERILKKGKDKNERQVMKEKPIEKLQMMHLMLTMRIGKVIFVKR